jgi:chorismate-pyruvate lyase
MNREKAVPEPIEDFFLKMSGLVEQSIEPGHARAALNALGELPGFLRSLLVADGTVTMALEAYFDEGIRIETLRQEPLQLPCELPVMNMQVGDLSYFRQVRLLGESTGTCYAEATSVLNKNAIGDALFEQLVDEHVGIGVILRNSAKGSFREVLSVERGSLLAGFDVHRTYRVSLSGVPAILISEEFPLAVYR